MKRELQAFEDVSKLQADVDMQSLIDRKYVITCFTNFETSEDHAVLPVGDA